MSAAIEMESGVMRDRHSTLKIAPSVTCRLVFAFFGICIFCGSSKSAEIRLDKFWNGHQAVIEGDIVEGDYM